MAAAIAPAIAELASENERLQSQLQTSETARQLAERAKQHADKGKRKAQLALANQQAGDLSAGAAAAVKASIGTGFTSERNKRRHVQHWEKQIEERRALLSKGVYAQSAWIILLAPSMGKVAIVVCVRTVCD